MLYKHLEIQIKVYEKAKQHSQRSGFSWRKALTEAFSKKRERQFAQWF